MKHLEILPAIVLATTLTSSCNVYVPEHHQVIKALTNSDKLPLTSCINPSTYDTQQVNALLEKPSLAPTMSRGPFHPSYDKQLQKFRNDTAHKLGVHIFQAPKELLEASYNLHVPIIRPLSFTDYFRIAQMFTNKFGVSLEVATQAELYAYGAHAPTPTDLRSVKAATAVLNAALAFDNMTVEAVRLSGVKRIKLISGAKAGVTAYVKPSTHEGTVYEDIENNQYNIEPTHVLNHELYHLSDEHECGDKYGNADPDFEILNGKRHVYTGKAFDSTFPSFTNSDVTQRIRELQREFLKYPYVGGVGSIANCPVIKKISALSESIVAYSDYHPNVGEDKAEIGAEISNTNNYHDLINPENGIMNTKFRFLLARLFHIAPKLVTYYAEVGDRPRPFYNNTDTSCNQIQRLNSKD